MKDEVLDIVIRPDGTTSFVYSDELAEVFEGMLVTTRRASHVEPHPTRQGWLSDMSPSGGPVLGFECSTEDVDWSVVCPECARFPNRCDHVTLTVEKLKPFQTRQQALVAEREWLREHKGL